MSKSLSTEDRHAVDTFFNRTQLSSTGGYLAPGTVTPLRVESVERVLSLLQEMPTSEPPADLVAKTMRRVEQAIGDGTRISIPGIQAEGPVA